MKPWRRDMISATEFGKILNHHIGDVQMSDVEARL